MDVGGFFVYHYTQLFSIPLLGLDLAELRPVEVVSEHPEGRGSYPLVNSPDWDVVLRHVGGYTR